MLFMNAGHIPGDPQRLVEIGHAVCAALRNHESDSSVEARIVALGFTQHQAVVITGVANGSYCSDVNPGGASSAVPTS